MWCDAGVLSGLGRYCRNGGTDVSRPWVMPPVISLVSPPPCVLCDPVCLALVVFCVLSCLVPCTSLVFVWFQFSYAHFLFSGTSLPALVFPTCLNTCYTLISFTCPSLVHSPVSDFLIYTPYIYISPLSLVPCQFVCVSSLCSHGLCSCILTSCSHVSWAYLDPACSACSACQSLPISLFVNKYLLFCINSASELSAFGSTLHNP